MNLKKTKPDLLKYSNYIKKNMDLEIKLCFIC